MLSLAYKNKVGLHLAIETEKPFVYQQSLSSKVS